MWEVFLLHPVLISLMSYNILNNFRLINFWKFISFVIILNRKGKDIFINIKRNHFFLSDIFKWFFKIRSYVMLCSFNTVKCIQYLKYFIIYMIYIAKQSDILMPFINNEYKWQPFLFSSFRRIFGEPTDKEIYVCYHESIKQNLVELAYQTCFSVIA